MLGHSAVRPLVFAATILIGLAWAPAPARAQKASPEPYKEAAVRILRASTSGLVQDALQWRREVDATDFGVLLDPARLSANGAVLEDCGRFDTLVTSADTFAARMHAHLEETRAALRALGGPAAYREAVIRGFEAGVAERQPRLEMLIDRSRLGYAEVSTLCRVLARRHWRIEQGVYAFTDTTDHGEFVAAATRFDGYMQEAAALQAEAAKSLRAE